MSEQIAIQTEREDVELRQLHGFEDTFAYSEAVLANREHLSQFGDNTAEKYPDYESVLRSVLHPSNPDKLRFGIWDGEQFVGSIKMTPEGEQAEIGYWLDGRFTGRGYATIAVRSLAGYAKVQHKQVFAEVVKGNEASIGVLERAGFSRQEVSEDADHIRYTLSDTDVTSQSSENNIEPKQRKLNSDELQLVGRMQIETARDALLETDFNPELSNFLSGLLQVYDVQTGDQDTERTGPNGHTLFLWLQGEHISDYARDLMDSLSIVARRGEMGAEAAQNLREVLLARYGIEQG